MLYGQWKFGQYVKTLSALAILGFAGACADNKTVEPVSAAPKVYAPANFTQTGTAVSFTVHNSKGIGTMIGQHYIYIPAQAICDLTTSGYGPEYWDKPCKPLKGSVIITGTVFTGPGGEPYVDFQPAMRFAPDKAAMLFFREGRSNGAWVPTVKFCNNVGYCIDESLTDPSLAIFRVEKHSILGRRVKHFTGYTVTYEELCPGSPIATDDGNLMCSTEGSVGVSRRSGYMVASGEDVRNVMNAPTERPEDDKQQ